jgi:hypothetical protein
MEIVGPLSIGVLHRVVKQVQASSHEKCVRVFKRSEPLMVKWLSQRREHILRPEPVVTCVSQMPAALPEAPLVIVSSGIALTEPDENDSIMGDEEFENA